MPWVNNGSPIEGPPGTIDSMTITMIPEGAAATATVGGEPGARTANLRIPRTPGGLTEAQQIIFDQMQLEVASLKKLLEEQQLDILISKSDGPLSGGVRPTWHAVLRVGESRTLKTFDAAITAARALPGATTNFGQGTYYYNMPARGRRVVDNRVLILFDPGTYQQTDLNMTTISDGIDLVGVGSSREDVVLKTNTINYNLRSWGSNYVKNLTLWHDQGPTGNNYCYHMNSIAGTYGYVNIFDNVWFRDSNTASSGCVGVDGQDGQVLGFYRCKFTSSARSATASRLVIHDMPNNRYGFKLFYVDCEIDKTEAQLAGDLGPIGYAPTSGPANGGATYQTWRQGCKTIGGPAITDKYWVGQVETSPSPSLPLPSESISSLERDKYTPRTPAGTYRATASGLEFVALVPLRMYFVPLPTVTGSAYVRYMEQVIQARAAATTQMITGGIYVEFQNLDGTWPGQPGLGLGNVNWSYDHQSPLRVNALANFQGSNDSNKLAIDARTRLWVGTAVREGAVNVEGSSTFSNGSNCWYQTLTTTAAPAAADASLTRVAAGAVVPIPRLLLA